MMLQEIGMNVLLKALIFSLLLFLCKKDKRVYILLFILISSLNEIVLRMGRLYHNSSTHLHWNWGGKILSIIISIAFVILLKRFLGSISFDDYKISLGHKIKAKKAILFSYAIFIAAIISSYIFSNKQPFNMEQLLFQLTMPGLDEELSYRGIYLALLNAAFIKKYKFLDAKFGMGLIIVSIQFGLIHALSVSPSMGISFDFANFAATGMVGFGLGVLAESTGSLILPIVSHNIFNVVNFLLGVFK